MNDRMHPTEYQTGLEAETGQHFESSDHLVLHRLTGSCLRGTPRCLNASLPPALTPFMVALTLASGRAFAARVAATDFVRTFRDFGAG